MTTLVNRGSDEPSPEQKRAMLKELLRRRSQTPRTAPLSSGQERLWFLDQLVPGSPLYVECGAVRIREPFDSAVMERALNEVVRRHEILRTTFVEQDGRPVQRIAPALRLRLNQESLPPGDDAAREHALQQRIREESRRPFRLSEGPLLRVTVIQLGLRDIVALIAIHHIVCDGWSIGVLIQEVLATYLALAAGRSAPLPPLPMQYADYAAQQRASLRDEAVAQHLQYWKSRFAGRPLVLNMPADHPASPARVPPGATQSFEFPRPLGDALRDLSAREGVTLFMTLLAAFKVLLREYAAQDDVTVVSPIAGRTRPEHEPLIGFFVNSLLLRTDLSGDPPFRAVLQRVRDTVLGALAHQDLPFDRVVAAVVPPSRRRGSETLPVAFALHHDLTAPLEHSGLRAQRMEVDPGTAKADLTLFIWVGQAAIRASIEYRTDVYQPATIQRLWKHYLRLLERVSSDPDQPLSELLVLGPAESAALHARREALAQRPAALPAVENLTNLTEDQFLIWMDQQLQPDSPLFNLVTVFRVETDLDPAHFRRAWADLVRGRDSLRTVYEVENGLPRRRVLRDVQSEVPLVDLSREPDPEAALRDWAVRRVERVFDLRRPSFDIVMLRLGRRRWAVYFNQHHISCDGWSASLLVRDLAQLYAASRAGTLAPLPPVPPFDDFVEHLRRQRQTDEYRAANEYWARKLEQHSAEPLSFYGRTNRLRTTRTRRVEVDLGARRSARLEAIAATPEFSARTPNLAYLHVFTAALAVFLQRISGCDRLAVATPLANRPPAFRRTPGQFMKVVPLFIEIQEDDTLLSLSRRIAGELRGAMEHAQVSVRNPRNNVYETLINLQHRPEYPDFDGAPIASEFPEIRHENLSLSLHVWPPRREHRDFLLHFDLLCDVFDGPQQELAVEHFLRTLDGLLDDPQRPLRELSLVSAAEREQLLNELAPGPAVALPDRPLFELFAEQAARTPEAPAVECAARRLSYAELQREAERIAARLRAAGVARGALVGVYLPRSIELIASMLGVLRAGGAYVPLDVDWPAERLSYVVQDASLRVTLTSGALAANLAAERELTVIRVDDPGAGEAPPSPGDDSWRTGPDDPVYVIYTSGSTGKPKGVAIRQRGALNFIIPVMRAYAKSPGDRALQFHSPAFDTSVEEIFPTLLGGATIVVRGEELPAPGEEWLRYVRERRLTVLDVPSAYWHEWMAEMERSPQPMPETVRLVVTGGERVLGKHFATWVRWTGGRVQWINGYGPTEATVACTMDETPPEAPSGETEPENPPIGRPRPNVRVYVLDRALQLVPPGVPGELCVGGDCLAIGYLNRPELTAARFVPDPYCEAPGARMYRTGDRVRWRADGRLEFIGRLDRQIKLRGFRIEPGEIETMLGAHPDVREAAVLLRERGAGGPRLVAYVTAAPGAAPAAAALQRFVAKQLPPHMVPSNVIVLDDFPRTSGGKIDLTALAKREDDVGVGSETYQAPRTPLECTLAAIVGDVLGISHVGMHDNFFELGGHSLLATQVMSRVRAACRVEIPLRVLFESPTVAELAEHVLVAQAEANLREAPPIVPVPRDGDPPLSYAQQRLWVLEQLLPGAASTMNIPGGVRLSGPLNVDAMNRAVNEVFRRHESLRTTIAVVDGRPVQRIAPEVRFETPIVDLRRLPSAAREDEARRLATECAAQPFDLSQGPLMRTLLIRLGPDEHIMVVVLHHIVADGWSINIVIREFVLIYPSLLAGRGLMLPDPPIQYADFAHWQRQRMSGEVGERLLAYWRSRLAPPLPLIRWPVFRAPPALPTLRGRTRAVRFDGPLVADLRRLAQSEGCTLYMVLLAALDTLIHRYTGDDDVIIGSPIANRTRVEAEGLIGYVANTLVLRSDLSGNPTFRELMQRVREVLLAAYAHQELPFELLVESLGRAADPIKGTLFQVLFILHNAPSTTVSFHDLKLALYELDPGTAPFDITLFLNDTAGVLDGQINFRTDVFDDQDIDRFLGHYEALLRSAAAAPDTPIDSLPLLTPRERRMIDPATARTTGATAEARSIAHALAGVAAVRGSATLSPPAPLAHHLAAHGIQRGDRVAICIEEPAALCTGAAALLLAGAEVLPLPVDESDEFLARVLREAGASAALARGAQVPRLAQLGIRAIDADAADARATASAAPAAAPHALPDADAYWVYDLNDEGLPRLAAISQRALAEHAADLADELHLAPGDRLLLLAGVEVHRAIELGLAAALRGAQVIASDAADAARRYGEADAPLLWERLEREVPTVLVLPAAAAELAEFVIAARAALPDSVRVIVTEDARAAAPADAADDAAAGPDWIDLVRIRAGGLTTLVHRPLLDEALAPSRGRVLSGRSLARTRLLVLERGMQPAPVGVRGLLAIDGSAAPTRLLHPDTTSLAAGPRLITLPDADRPLFLTACPARLRPDGQIELI